MSAVDGRFAKARSASAVAAAAAQSNADCVRRTTAAKKATAAEETRRARVLFGALKRELPAGYGIRGELLRAEFLGNDDGDVRVSVEFASHFFEFANSSENAAVAFEALEIIVDAFGGKAALPCERSGIHEEFVLLLTKISADDVAVSAAFAALGKMAEPEETYLLACLLEEVPDDEVPGPLFSLPLGTSSILELGPWLFRLL